LLQIITNTAHFCLISRDHPKGLQRIFEIVGARAFHTSDTFLSPNLQCQSIITTLLFATALAVN